MAWLKKDDQRYIPPYMTDVQMKALECFIAASHDASEFAKKVIIWTLRQTENLTHPVALSVWDKDYGPDRTEEVQDGAHAMLSSNGSTFIDLFFAGMGTEMRLEHHCGCYENRDDKKSSRDSFNSKAPGRTIWVSHIFYDREATVLEAPSLAELEALELPK